MSRGLKNCNPGNIRRSRGRYKGEVVPSRDPAFKQFESLAWGYRAIFVLLHTYRTRHGLRTIAEMIARWAPPSENRTDAYIRAVSDRTGIGPHEPSTRATARPWCPSPRPSRGWKTAWRPTCAKWNGAGSSTRMRDSQSFHAPSSAPEQRDGKRLRMLCFLQNSKILNCKL